MTEEIKWYYWPGSQSVESRGSMSKRRIVIISIEQNSALPSHPEFCCILCYLKFVLADLLDITIKIFHLLPETSRPLSCGQNRSSNVMPSDHGHIPLCRVLDVDWGSPLNQTRLSLEKESLTFIQSRFSRDELPRVHLHQFSCIWTTVSFTCELPVKRTNMVQAVVSPVGRHMKAYGAATPMNSRWTLFSVAGWIDLPKCKHLWFRKLSESYLFRKTRNNLTRQRMASIFAVLFSSESHTSGPEWPRKNMKGFPSVVSARPKEVERSNAVESHNRIMEERIKAGLSGCTSCSSCLTRISQFKSRQFKDDAGLLQFQKISFILQNPHSE